MSLPSKLAQWRTWAAEEYSIAGGNVRNARRAIRSRSKRYGFDIATAMLLMQLALMLWKWAKDKGLFSTVAHLEYEDEPDFVAQLDDPEQVRALNAWSQEQCSCDANCTGCDHEN